MSNAYRAIVGGGGGAAVGDATAADVLTGKTFSGAVGSGVSGTMPNNGAVSQTLAAGQSYTVPAGYHNGSGTVTADPAVDEIDSYEIYTGNSSVTMSKSGLAYIWCQDTSGTYTVSKNATPITFKNVVSTSASNTYPMAVVPISAGDVIAYSTPAGLYINIVLGVIGS